MSNLPVYRWSEPGRMSLLDELARRPSTLSAVPQEEQLTTVLGWLCDRSDVIATTLVEAFFKGDRKGMRALRSSARIAAQVQPNLPPLPDGGCRADISLAGEDRSFQLLIEAKLGAPFERRRVGRRTISQPDAYIRAWEHCDPQTEADIRRVGTLRLDGDPPSSIGHEWRTRDLKWSDLHRLIGRLLGDGRVPPEASGVAHDLHRYLEQRVLHPKVSDATLRRGAEIVRAVCARLVDELPGRVGTTGFRVNRNTQYAGAYLNDVRTRHASRGRFWIAFTPAATSYNIPGWPTVLQLQLTEPWIDPIEALMLAAGFEDSHDRAGYHVLSAKLLEEPSTQRPFDELVGSAIANALALFEGITPDSTAVAKASRRRRRR
jgi:hypothetical protein